jgi:hypothetical protein
MVVDISPKPVIVQNAGSIFVDDDEYTRVIRRRQNLEEKVSDFVIAGTWYFLAVCRYLWGCKAFDSKRFSYASLLKRVVMTRKLPQSSNADSEICEEMILLNSVKLCYESVEQLTRNSAWKTLYFKSRFSGKFLTQLPNQALCLQSPTCHLFRYFWIHFRLHGVQPTVSGYLSLQRRQIVESSASEQP